MKSVKSIKEVSLQHKIEDVIEFLKEKRLLHLTRTCSVGHSMKFESRKDIGDKYRWKCSKCNEVIKHHKSHQKPQSNLLQVV